MITQKDGVTPGPEGYGPHQCRACGCHFDPSELHTLNGYPMCKRDLDNRGYILAPNVLQGHDEKQEHIFGRKNSSIEIEAWRDLRSYVERARRVRDTDPDWFGRYRHSHDWVGVLDDVAEGMALAWLEYILGCRHMGEDDE